MIERYSTKEMQAIWTEQNKWDAFLKVEILSAEAWSEMGHISKEEVEKLWSNATYSIERILEIEKETKHDIVAFTRAVSESLGEEKRWVHYGLTSTDVVDTGQGYILKQANEILLKNIKKLMESVKEKALQYKDTPCIGRTHGVHADITSFGLKWALWYDELNRNLNRFENACKEVEIGKISGAVGNFANTPPFVQDYVCEKLGINSSNISTQTLQRDRHANYLSSIALIATTIEKMGIEIRHLQRTEVREVQEGFTKGQKGSSAMPHKKNPISSENMAGCARVIRGYMNTAFDNITLWHERDISHSSAERIILPDSTILLDYMLNRFKNVIDTLGIFPENMIVNINKTNGVIFTQRVMINLIDKGCSREYAYDLVQPLAQDAWENGLNLIDLLKGNENVMNFVTEEELSDCFTLEYYLKRVDEIYKRVGLI